MQFLRSMFLVLHFTLYCNTQVYLVHPVLQYTAQDFIWYTLYTVWSTIKFHLVHYVVGTVYTTERFYLVHPVLQYNYSTTKYYLVHLYNKILFGTSCAQCTPHQGFIWFTLYYNVQHDKVLFS